MRLEDLPTDLDVRLVVSDLDGTLLNDRGQVPDSFWPLLEKMRGVGVVFAPASGRQSATLARMFRAQIAGMPLIAENGTYVVRDGVEISSATVAPESWRAVVEAGRAAASEFDLGLVVCGKKAGYLERHDQAFVQACAPYYASLRLVPDQLDVDDDVLKIAVFDFDDAEKVLPRFEPFRAGHQVVVSGRNWIDIMGAGANKGVAVRALQAKLGVDRAQTIAFGDFFNDLEMLDEAQWSFATANAHPAVQAHANFLAPENTREGVVRVLEHLMGFDV